MPAEEKVGLISAAFRGPLMKPIHELPRFPHELPRFPQLRHTRACKRRLEQFILVHPGNKALKLLVYEAFSY